jgi:glycosyltransferase involved in cell wall biosynthesis
VLANKWLRRAIDLLVARRLEPCDLMIGMSGLCIESAKAARNRFGARIVVERGSRHILSQKAILDAIAGNQRWIVGPEDVRRELGSYGLADIISVPSRHVEESFASFGVLRQRIFRNPYGVDLSMFAATRAPRNVVPVVMMAGSWSLRKGCDVLWDACRADGHWRLAHVGVLEDAPVPDSPLFSHLDPVPQWKLAELLGQADAFVLASREEGLALVQVQALACGLPVACTDRTGGEDLGEMLPDPRWITVARHGDTTRLRVAVCEALKNARGQNGIRDILGPRRPEFSWKAYGRRYHEKIVAGRE